MKKQIDNILIEREKDIFFRSEDMENLFTFSSFPVYMGCTKSCESEDLFAEQTWQISKSTGVMQLKKLVPLEILYANQHFEPIGKIWMQHHEEFSKFINKFNAKNILEIGGGTGLLASIAMKSKSNLNWTIIEVNPIPIEDCKAKFINGFFNNDYKHNGKLDTIIHSHVFEHLYNPLESVQAYSNLLDKGQRMIFSIPNMKEMLKRKYTNCINFEHTFFITEELINWLLMETGFSIEDKKYFKDDHSIFYSCIKNKSKKASFNNYFGYEIYTKNKKIFNQYINYHKKLVQDINNQLEAIDQKVYLFGAHIFSQFLLQFNLDSKKIDSILDNNKSKIGRRLYGTNLKVKTPKILENKKNPIVILKAGAYNDEIKKDILENINDSTIFI